MLSASRLNEARIQRDSPLRFELAVAERGFTVVFINSARVPVEAFTFEGRAWFDS